MSQDPEQFMYFKVGLLKDSATLDALWQDALKHHMVDRPDKLIALRLTEYYEIIAKGIVQPFSQGTTTKAGGDGLEQGQIAGADGRGHYSANSNRPPEVGSGANHQVGQVDDIQVLEERVRPMGTDAEQNAEDAADYWALL